MSICFTQMGKPRGQWYGFYYTLLNYSITRLKCLQEKQLHLCAHLAGARENLGVWPPATKAGNPIKWELPALLETACSCYTLTRAQIQDIWRRLLCWSFYWCWNPDESRCMLNILLRILFPISRQLSHVEKSTCYRTSWTEVPKMKNNPRLAQIRSSKASSQEQSLGKPELSSNPNPRVLGGNESTSGMQ